MSNETFSKRVKIFTVEFITVATLFIVALIAFGVLARAIVSDAIIPWNTTIFDSLVPLRSKLLTSCMIAISWLASSYFLLPVNLLLTIYFLYARHKTFLIKIPVITLAGYLLNQLLKFVFANPRPADPLFQAARGFSFPSGHSMSAMIFYGMLVFLVWRTQRSAVVRTVLTSLLIIVIFLVGFSRVYLHVHYASDVIAGFSMGFIWLTSSILITNFIEQKVLRLKASPTDE